MDERFGAGTAKGKRQDELIAILQQEEDFMNSLTTLEEEFESSGRAKFIFLPKFHPAPGLIKMQSQLGVQCMTFYNFTIFGKT